jgi:hypothetical protein
MHPSPVQMYLRATVQDGVSGLDKQLQIFLLSMHQYGRSFLLTYIEKMAAFVCLAQFR